jgi:hypothetical protein
MKLTEQALSCLMVALQKSLMEQTDIVPVLKGFEFITDEEDGLIVTNPPTAMVLSEDE